ncbi:MAG: hypothetical protein MN733_07125 [Nitrososphaera sp.]|nr:hypothetical protein [Nitrososphaera sp.]
MNEAKLSEIEIAQKVLNELAAMSDEELCAVADEYDDAPIGRAIMALPSCALCGTKISHFHLVQHHVCTYGTITSRKVLFSIVSVAANDEYYQLAA